MRIRCLFLLLLPLGSAALAHDIPPGLYAIEYRLEMPHLERYAVTNRVERCTDGERLPVISAKGAFASCTLEDRINEPSRLRYSLTCPGASTARAFAEYKPAPDGFTGRIFVKLGAKNMTLTEVQRGIRLGACPAPPATSEATSP